MQVLNSVAGILCDWQSVAHAASTQNVAASKAWDWNSGTILAPFSFELLDCTVHWHCCSVAWQSLCTAQTRSYATAYYADVSYAAVN